MRDAWLDLVGAVLEPARPHLEVCLRERAAQAAVDRAFAVRQAQELAECASRIEKARSAVFAANDGVVTAEMTRLEREWRALSRPDHDGRLMNLWARLVPPAWLDRKLWRDSEPLAQLDVAIALAADLDGVEAASRAIHAFGVALAAFTPRGALPLPSIRRIRWSASALDADPTSELLAEPLRAALSALSARHEEAIVLGRARRLEREVHDALRARFPRRPLLARGVSHAAFVDYAVCAASLGGLPNPVTSLRELWATGYVLSALSASGATVELPPLSTVELSSAPQGSVRASR